MDETAWYDFLFRDPRTWDVAEATLVATVAIPILLFVIPASRHAIGGAFRSMWGGLTHHFDHKTHPPSEKTLRRHIFGRDALLREIEARLGEGKTAAIAPVAAVTGGAGVGKSTLARYYLQKRGGKYDRTAWFDAELAQTLMQQLCDQPDLAVPVEGRLEDRAKRARACIEADSSRRWLVIFDNVEDLSLVDRFMPVAGHVHGLFTTRQSVAATPARAPIETGPLAPDDAVALLEAEAERTDPEAEALAEDVGRLPLGLVQAGEWLSLKPRVSFADYRRRLAELVDDWPYVEDDAPDYFLPLGAALTLAIDEVEKDRRTGPDEMALLRLMPWLAPEGIDAKLVLDVARTEAPPDFIEDLQDDVRALSMAPKRLQRALHRLGERALATVSGEGEARHAALHRVTALVLRARLAPEAPTLRRAAAATVAAGYPGGERPDDRASWPDCTRLNPHVAALAMDPPTTMAMDFLLNQSALYWSRQGEASLALSYARWTLNIQKGRLGSSHPTVAIGHNVLAGRLGEAGHWDEAVAEYEAALRIAETRGLDYLQLGALLSNLAWALEGRAGGRRAADEPEAAAADLARAERLLKRAWAASRQHAPRPELNDTLAAHLHNLATIYDKQGRFRRANCFATTALRIRREKLRSNDPRLAFTLNNLGAMRLRSKDVTDAVPLLREALAIREDAFAANPAHPLRIQTAQWLAPALFALDPPQAAEAEALCARYGLDPTRLRAHAVTLRRAARW